MQGPPLRRPDEEAIDQRHDPHDPQQTTALQITDPPAASATPDACVSYAWKAEASSDPARAGKVEYFCERLNLAGIEVIRDRTHADAGARWSEFMRQISGSRRVFVFLSNAYLESANCLRELLGVWQTSLGDPAVFLARTRVFVMPGTDIHTPAGRDQYVQHWQRERGRLDQQVRETSSRSEPRVREWKTSRDVAQNLDDILACLADVNRSTDLDAFIEQSIAEFEM